MLKVIQLNCWNFRYFEELLEFLKQEKPDIINLQEISSGDLIMNANKNFDFEYLKKELGMNGVFVHRFGVKDSVKGDYFFGNGFLTNLEIVDYGSFFDKFSPDFSWYNKDNPIFSTFKNDKYKAYVNSFELPVNFVWGTLKYKNEPIRNITSHFTVSFKCTETLQILRQARQLVGFLDSVKELPTIFSGDLNIHGQSNSVKLIESKLNRVPKDIINTMNPNIGLKLFNDEPQGLAVDHLFTSKFDIISCKSPNITVSDHLPVIAEIELLT